MIRLNKYLSEAGVCSRREADRLIETGRVTVDGVRAVPGMKVSEEKEKSAREKSDQGCRTEGCSGSQQTGRYRVYRGCESENNIYTFPALSVRVTYAGRLDKDSKAFLL